MHFLFFLKSSCFPDRFQIQISTRYYIATRDCILKIVCEHASTNSKHHAYAHKSTNYWFESFLLCHINCPLYITSYIISMNNNTPTQTTVRIYSALKSSPFRKALMQWYKDSAPTQNAVNLINGTITQPLFSISMSWLAYTNYMISYSWWNLKYNLKNNGKFFCTYF